MPVAMRSYLTAGLTVVGVATAVVAPFDGSEAGRHMVGGAYDLTAVSSPLSNVPVNLFNMVMSVPAWEVEAIGRLADAMTATGSWQVWGPTNVFGFDEEDPPKLEALVDMFMPIRPVSTALGTQLSWWARANLPMNAGCAAAQNACPDPKAMLDSMFRVPTAELFRGYQFPVVANPFTGQPTSWSGQYVKLDRNATANALRDYLTAPPVGIKTVSPGEAVNAVSRLATSFNQAFYPFVQNSQWFDNKHTVLAPLFRALAPVLCASCDPANPYDNEWLKNYGSKPAAGAAGVVGPGSAANVSISAAGSVDSQERPALPPRGFMATDDTLTSEPARRPSAPRGHRRIDTREDVNPAAAQRERTSVSVPDTAGAARSQQSGHSGSESRRSPGRNR